MTRRFTFPQSVRRSIERFAAVVCPPGPHLHHRLAALVEELERYIAAIPPHMRILVVLAFVLFDQGARLYRPARGRRFSNLDAGCAERYYRKVAYESPPAVRSVIKLLKGMVTLQYYELPDVQAELGYYPAAYIAQVTHRRATRYAEQIRTGQEAVFTGAPFRTSEQEHDQA